MTTPDHDLTEAHLRLIETKVEICLHGAKRIAIDTFGADAAHGHAEVITRIAHSMATLSAAETIAAAIKERKD